MVLHKIKKGGWGISAAVVFMSAALLLTGCGEKPQKESKPTPQTSATEDLGLILPPTEPPTEPIVEEPVGIPVTTPYMLFYYPQELAEKVAVKQTEDGGNCRVTFQTEIAGKTTELFSIVLGPDGGEGYFLGALTDDQAGTVYIYSIMAQINPEDWTEAAYTELCSLQERVNDIIVQFYEDERFIPNR